MEVVINIKDILLDEKPFYRLDEDERKFITDNLGEEIYDYFYFEDTDEEGALIYPNLGHSLRDYERWQKWGDGQLKTQKELDKELEYV